MINLLSAALLRLRKNMGFWLALLAMAAYGVFVGAVCWQRALEGSVQFGMEEPLLFGFGAIGSFPFHAFVMAPLFSAFLGAEYSDGALRNKLIVGRTRQEVYLSGLLTCVGMALVLMGVYLVTVLAVGFPAVGTFHIPLPRLAALLGVGLLALTAYAAVVHLAVTLAGRRSTAITLTLLGAVAAMGLCTYLMSRLEAPEFITEYILGASGFEEPAPRPNSAYLPPAARAAVQFVLDLLPTGQCLQTARMTPGVLWRMPLLSLAVLAASTGAGLFFFRKKDLK